MVDYQKQWISIRKRSKTLNDIWVPSKAYDAPGAFRCSQRPPWDSLWPLNLRGEAFFFLRWLYISYKKTIYSHNIINMHKYHWMPWLHTPYIYIYIISWLTLQQGSIDLQEPTIWLIICSGNMHGFSSDKIHVEMDQNPSYQTYHCLKIGDTWVYTHV